MLTSERALAFIAFFAPAARVARRFPELPPIPDDVVHDYVDRFEGFDPAVLARGFRTREWMKHGVSADLAFKAALEAERRPSTAEIRAWEESC